MTKRTEERFFIKWKGRERGEKDKEEKKMREERE